MIEVACLLLAFDVVFIWYGCCLAGGDQLADSSSWAALNEEVARVSCSGVLIFSTTAKIMLFPAIRL